MGMQDYVAYLALGANLPWMDGAQAVLPQNTLRAAVQTLAALGEVEAGSELWRTEPVGPFREQPAFVNAAVRLRTTLLPRDLLAELQAVEQRFGRVREPSVDKGPRTLDLDILLLERNGHPVLVEAPGLQIPHAEMHRRRFVLAPLAEIAANAVHPVYNETVETLLHRLPEGERVEKMVTDGSLNVLPNGLLRRKARLCRAKRVKELC